ncbi:MAG: PQQ-binding-like beta-propeller repeat protein [Candidatus Eisenbacteria bacterium]|uniref:PQQ-binding-like beta-propeller repeat protein n=1 Tax=Eiseniibacteriota bacterium TaxID=2212470 RepID=A0A948RYY3_UNCEI|nr:PQQ-binding-like beta-propeller repeat protein [Candidatus Eisenbacteria bacterium]MBU2693405.1 PQQ-binding-like beta-propeller repeat protein [Candidatus Eisenbacteria bacterium]
MELQPVRSWRVDPSQTLVLPPFQRIWEGGIGGRIEGGMTHAGRLVIVTSLNRRCAAFDFLTGRRVWRVKLPDRPVGPPEVAGGCVWIIVGPQKSRLLAFDLLTGHRILEQSIPPSLGPAVVQDSVVITTALSGEILGFRRSSNRRGESDGELHLLWKKTLEGGFRNGPLAWNDSLLIAGALDGSIAGLRIKDGEILWKLPVGGAVYGLTPYRDDLVATLYNGEIVGFSPEDGELLWKRSVQGPLLTPAATSENIIVTAATGGEITAIDPYRGILWETTMKQVVVTRPVMTSEAVLIATRRGALVGLNRWKGTRDWSLTFKNPLLVPPCVTPQRLLIADGRGGLRAFHHGGSTGTVISESRQNDIEMSQLGVPADSAWLSVQSIPQGRGILIDGAFAGWTPLDSVHVASGFHRIALRDSAGRSAGLPLRARDMQLSADSHERVTFYPELTIRLETSPTGVFVSEQGNPIGSTPLAVRQREGMPLRLSYPGFQDTLLTIGPQTSSPLRIRMKASDDAGPGSGWNALRRNQAERPWYTKSWVRWGAPVLAVAAGAAAVYLRRQGNDAYNDYRGTGDTDAMRRYFDRAERFDRGSIVSWVTAELFFGLSFYSWIRHDEELEKAADLPGTLSHPPDFRRRKGGMP